jgi:hypothetical protein
MNTFFVAAALALSSLLPLAQDLRPAEAPLGNAAPVALSTSWSQDPGLQGSWDNCMSVAANLVEGGFSDWRLPTRAELQSAIQNGTLPAITVIPPSSSFWIWTSERKGTRAYAVVITTDAAGVVIPSQSGSVQLPLRRSNLNAVAIRP